MPVAIKVSSHTDVAPEATYSGCVTRGSKKVILHCFPAHVIDLQQIHRDELDRLAFKVRNGDLTGRRIRTIRIEGHAASWRGLSEADYNSRSKARAIAARDYLRGQLDRMGLSYRPRIDVTWFGDRSPLVDNLVSSTSSAARRNREINRRVEIFLAGAPKPVKPAKPDKPVITDWDAFLNTKLSKLRDHWDVQRPFHKSDIQTCVLGKMLKKRVRTNVVEPMGTAGALPARDPIKWTDLRKDLISDLKKGYARGPIRNFERRFGIHVDNMFTAVRQLGFRASGSDIYNSQVTSAWRKVKRLSKRSAHVYSCKVIRDHIAAVDNPWPW